MITFSPVFFALDLFMTMFFVVMLFKYRQKDNKLVALIAVGMFGVMALVQAYLLFFGPIHLTQ